MFFNGGFTVKVVYPNSIEPLLDPNLLKENGRFDIFVRKIYIVIFYPFFSKVLFYRYIWLYSYCRTLICSESFLLTCGTGIPSQLPPVTSYKVKSITKSIYQILFYLIFQTMLMSEACLRNLMTIIIFVHWLAQPPSLALLWLISSPLASR
jgi:hypothetical protein